MARIKAFVCSLVMAVVISGLIFLPESIIAAGQQFEFLLNQQRYSSGALAGGKVYFYEAGTTTDKTIYTDIALTTPAANPYMLDANGTALLYGNGTYRVVIKTAALVTVYDRDNIKVNDRATDLIDSTYTLTLRPLSLVGNDTGNITGYDNITGSGTGRIKDYLFGSSAYTDNGYFNSLNATSGRFAGQPVFDVTHPTYGAKGDGTTDDTVAIQAAITAAKVYCEDSTGYRRGAVVFFPRGEYKVTAPLNATTALQKSDGMTFRGIGKRGSMITAVLASGGPVLDLTGQSYPRIEHMSIESRSASSNATTLVLLAENPANLTYSNRYPVFNDVSLMGYSPGILATVSIYNGDLAMFFDSYIANGVGTDAIAAGYDLPSGVTSTFVSPIGTRLDTTAYYISNSSVLGGHAVRIYGDATLYVNMSYLARIAPVGADNAIVVFEPSAIFAPSLIAHSLRVENQTTDNNISLVYFKGGAGGENIVIDGDIYLVDTDGDFPSGGYIRSDSHVWGNVDIHVRSDYADPNMFNVTGNIYGTVRGYSNHSAIGTVTEKIRGWQFTGNINNEGTMFTSLDGKLDGYSTGLSYGHLIMTNGADNVIKRVRLNDAGDGLLFDTP